ncbi:Protein of unknown function [Gryllus bimaculatus]|nr:Protein of unknown function [Gryllus bimaculatus]
MGLRVLLLDIPADFALSRQSCECEENGNMRRRHRALKGLATAHRMLHPDLQDLGLWASMN